jgi:hypothetical protein
MATPDLGKLLCPKCAKAARVHCAGSKQCDLVICEVGCGQGTKDGHLWSKNK